MALAQQTRVEERETGHRPVETSPHKRFPGWFGWTAAAIVILAVGILVALVIDGLGSDGSSERVDPTGQPQVAESVPGRDGFDVAESQRFRRSASEVDGSQVAETRRFQSYAPTTDASHETAEEARMRALSPGGGDGSFEDNEHNRMLGLKDS